jgi:prepilin-type N-terminal cleavage/methylation domain-containing protein/prepilin-type processing-associated H-X9-DG protein
VDGGWLLGRQFECEPLMRSSDRSVRWHRRGVRGFSLAELLVVVGVIALLLAIVLPPLQFAHRQAKQTRCAANLQQVGIALETIRNGNNDFYPLWDDGGSPKRYTWIDMLIQKRSLDTAQAGYCPEDARPDVLNMNRGAFYGVVYPGGGAIKGVDYSYGIGVPLSAGGWVWQSGFAGPGDTRARIFEDHESQPSARFLAGDANWTSVYNLSGDALATGVWNQPTQFDNTVAWRHRGSSANMLKQDGHVTSVRYQVANVDRPVDTVRHFLWYAGEPVHVGPDDDHQGNWYPNQPLYKVLADGQFEPDRYPLDLIPQYYTQLHLWTQILQK